MKESRRPCVLACLALSLLSFGAVPLAAACGDSLLDAGEECDDGNTAPSDGCSAACLIEDGWTCTSPVPAAAGTNVVADPSFEAGTPNPFWTELSTNFETPLCTVANCGEEGSGPNSSIWWAWFGGTVLFEEGSLTQSLVIPATATTLEFELEQIFCDSANDFLEVTLDDTQVFVTDGVSPLCGMLGYTMQSLDISAFADGGMHILEFYSQTVATNNDVTDFFVDDVVLLDNVAIPAQPSECFLLVPLACNGPLIDFDNPVSGIPRDWAVVDNEGSGVVWSGIVAAGEGGNYTGGTGEAATASSDAFGQAEVDTELRTAPFDLPALPAGSGALVHYLASYENFLNRDFLDLDISIDGGTNWTTLLQWNEDHGEFRAPPGEAVSVDLSPYLGLSGLLLRWHYYDLNTGDLAWYAQVDDIALVCGPPAIAVAPTSLAASQPPDVQTQETLTIENVGLGQLSWDVVETASSCAAPADIPWLSTSPGNATTSGGLETQVAVTADSTGLTAGTYNARLCIDSNDPSNPTVEVPVTMEVASVCPDNLVLTDSVLTAGEFSAGISITGGPDLLIDGPVTFVTSQEISFLNGVEIRDGFTAELAVSPCP